jgi:hypothetical protein
MRESLLNYGSQLSPDAAAKAAGRYRRGLDVLLRHEWAYYGRAQVLSRIAELAPLMPKDIERKYRLATLIPSMIPRTARRVLHLLHSLGGARRIVTSADAAGASFGLACRASTGCPREGRSG